VLKKKAVKKNFSIVIAGPTAVGKTAMAIRVAQALKTEIISADSRQCYRELSIGVARPEEQELATVPHHFIASHSIFDEWNAARYANYALELLQQLFTVHTTAVIVGGTGLYIKALTDGLDQLPVIEPLLRQTIQAEYGQKGLEWLQQTVKEKDPLYYSTGEIQNPHRLLRALEVILSTGRSIRSFQTGHSQPRFFQTIKIALELPREELVERINKRVDHMMHAGLLEEVKSVYSMLSNEGKSWKSVTALQTVGYKELFMYLEGQLSMDEAVEKIKQHTRQYAKRQMTWFKKDTAFKWYHPADEEAILNYIHQQIS
jgi:tRNA dimethylallyltransferase